MDLNYIYHRYAVSLEMANNAGCSASRMAHLDLARAYAARIADAKVNGTPDLSQ